MTVDRRPRIYIRYSNKPERADYDIYDEKSFSFHVLKKK